MQKNMQSITVQENQPPIEEWDFHLHNIIMNGIYIRGVNPFYEDLIRPGANRYRRLNFNFYNCRYDSIYRSAEETPYEYNAGMLYYENRLLSNIPFEMIVSTEDDWGSERNWWFKSIPTLDEYYDLRLNPINSCSNMKYPSGEDQKLLGCVFCQRNYGEQRLTENRRVVSPASMFKNIFEHHGSEVLKKVSKVMLVTGDLSNEEDMLDLVNDIYHNHLVPNGFKGVFSTVTTVIKTEQGIKSLARIDNTIFEFPVECFTRRALILGEKKGCSFEEVIKILKIAKQYFINTRINYLVGLDDINDAQRGFETLAKLKLVDDIIPNIFVPPTQAAMEYRSKDSCSMEYIYKMREIIESQGFRPKRISATKDLYSHFIRDRQDDELAPSLY